GEMIEFARLSDDGLRNWVIERFTEEGKEAARDVAEALIDLKGYDLRTLDSEIAKAVTYVGESPRVTPRDLEVLVGRSRTEQAFELISSVLAQNVGEALEILKDLLDTNQSPISMIYRLSSAARGLALLHRREREVEPQLKLPPVPGSGTAQVYRVGGGQGNRQG
ncbi:DNA polymerase III subunit delta, partial [Candidatus Eisenbacteria bacterium]